MATSIETYRGDAAMYDNATFQFLSPLEDDIRRRGPALLE